MQCLIGLSSPTRAGIGLPSGGLALTAASLRNGVHFKTSEVHCAICCVISFFDGRSMMLNVPRNRCAMYCSVDLPGTGCGPRGLAIATLPLPLAMRSFFPSGVTRTEVGYQPLGMNPSERLLPGV